MALRPHALTWTALLAKWVEFARAAVSFPRAMPGEEGRRWKAAVPDVINLQAVTFALADLEALADEERALALDKAAILIDAAEERLRAEWGGGALPGQLTELVQDARAALHAAGQA